MDDVKNCSKCETFSSKSKFFEEISKKAGCRPSCKVFCQKHYYNNQIRILNNHLNLKKNNRSKINAYER